MVGITSFHTWYVTSPCGDLLIVPVKLNNKRLKGGDRATELKVQQGLARQTGQEKRPTEIKVQVGTSSRQTGRTGRLPRRACEAGKVKQMRRRHIQSRDGPP